MRENLSSFLARMRAVFGEDDVHRIHIAYIVAKEEFRSKTRKERDALGKLVRYFEHLRHVAIIMVEEAGCRDAYAVIAALLHDAIEDTRLSLAFIETNFGREVARDVSQVSKVPKEGYLGRLLNFGSWKTFRLKACDRLHNLRTLHHGSIDFRRKQLEETVRDYYPLFDRMVDECSKKERKNMKNLRRLIHEEVATQRRLLDEATAASA